MLSTVNLYFCRNNVYRYSFIPSPPGGLNSGLMLMDLEAMRRGRWADKVVAAYTSLRRHLAFVDQVRNFSSEMAN